MDRRRFLFLFILLITLSACGGGGGGADGQQSSLTDTYLFYTKGLTAVDPANPASPTEIVPAANLVANPLDDSDTEETMGTVVSGRYDPATQTLTDLHLHAIVYAHTDGSIYKVSALKSGSLTPVRVSSETMAGQLCTDRVGAVVTNDLADVDDSQYHYVLPGDDGTCNTSDDVRKMVRLGMSTTDAPVFAKPAVSELIDRATGAIIGWLAHDSLAGELQHCDAGFANCTKIADVSNYVESYYLQTGNYQLLEIDNTMAVYDISGNTLSTVFSLPAFQSPHTAINDANTIYFPLGTSIYQLPIDGSAMATPLVTEATDITEIMLSADKLVYTLASSGPEIEIKSIAKTGGTSTSLVTTGGAQNLELVLAKNNHVYYNKQTRTASIDSPYVSVVPAASGIIDDDGTNQSETANTAWIGLTVSTTWDYSDSRVLADITDKLLRVDGYDPATNDYAGASITAVDPATAMDIATLDTLPAASPIAGVECFGIGEHMLCSTDKPLDPIPTLPASPVQHDLFYLNANTPNSLVPITNTPGENEGACLFICSHS